MYQDPTTISRMPHVTRTPHLTTGEIYTEVPHTPRRTNGVKYTDFTHTPRHTIGEIYTDVSLDKRKKRGIPKVRLVHQVARVKY